MANNSTLLVALTVALVLLLEQPGGGVLGQPPTSSMPCPAKKCGTSVNDCGTPVDAQNPCPGTSLPSGMKFQSYRCEGGQCVVALAPA